MDKYIANENRIPMIHKIKKYKKDSNKVMEKSKESRLRKSKTLEIGYINKNQQENLGCTGKSGNHEGQVLYKMKCLKCGNEYEANGCDVWLRKCSNCMK